MKKIIVEGGKALKVKPGKALPVLPKVWAPPRPIMRNKEADTGRRSKA